MMRLSRLFNLVEQTTDSDDLLPIPVCPSPSSVARALRLGMCPPDRAFDQFLPSELRVVSGQYWTPLVVAMRAAEWLDELNVRTVVDIGSGAGKFCVAAALSSRAQLMIGVEQRARLIAAARDLARVLDVGERVTFIHGAFGETPLPEADAYYLFNPFGENLFGSQEHLDEDVELGDARYRRDTAAVEQLLCEARVGTYLLTYNGFGGEVPSSYRQVREDLEMPNHLRMWRKTTLTPFPSTR